VNVVIDFSGTYSYLKSYLRDLRESNTFSSCLQPGFNEHSTEPYLCWRQSKRCPGFL